MPSDRSVSNHIPCPLRPFLAVLPEHCGFAIRSQARQHGTPNRVRLLRTGRSIPAALHPALRRRSCFHLWSFSDKLPVGLTPPDIVSFQAHERRALHRHPQDACTQNAVFPADWKSGGSFQLPCLQKYHGAGSSSHYWDQGHCRSLCGGMAVFWGLKISGGWKIPASEGIKSPLPQLLLSRHI